MSVQKARAWAIFFNFHASKITKPCNRHFFFEMNKLFSAFLTCFLSLSVFAQSGRRVQPATTPEKSIEAPIDYSESTPQKKRPIYIPPSFRGVSRSESKDKTDSQQDVIPIPQIEDGEEVVNVDTSLVTIPVSVFDRNGLYIPNLKQSNFSIFEDGKEQEIAYFGTTEKPFTVILLIDTSPSTAYKIEEIQRAAIAFVDQLKPQDSVMVIEFDGNVHVLTEITKDRYKIYKAIGKADFGLGTSLYDAVDFSLQKRLAKIEGRKAVVLFTDGVDTTSTKSSYDRTILKAEEADALVFPIYYNTINDLQGNVFNGVLLRPVPASDYALGRQYLEDLAAYTGGRVFRPEAVPGGLTAAFEGIAEELRRQYNIGYIPSEDGKPGERKQIKVRVDRPNLAIRSRDSYIVGSKPKSASNNTK